MKNNQNAASNSCSFGRFENKVRRALHICLLTFSTTSLLLSHSVLSFTVVKDNSLHHGVKSHKTKHSILPPFGKFSSTQLQVKWFGGSGWQDSTKSEELLGVKIERTSPNSRRIAGEIIVSKHMDDVWAILTDYDNLAIHVPNLVESRRLEPINRSSSTQGDGNYKCRLYQKGAQKIIGFEFGASVTMDMTENIRITNIVTPRVLKLGNEKKIQVGEQRRIYFKCVDSQFFSEFDGEWKCSWIDDPNDAFELATKVEYVVDVRPRGPVPVQALEWRIREDVPTNLRAVKAASVNLGMEGVLKMREQVVQRSSNSVRKSPSHMNGKSNTKSLQGSASIGERNRISASPIRRSVGNALKPATSVSVNAVNVSEQAKRKLAPVRVQWYDDETMAIYLDKRN